MIPHTNPSSLLLVMATRSDDRVQGSMPAQKLERVSPKISLMELGKSKMELP